MSDERIRVIKSVIKPVVKTQYGVQFVWINGKSSKVFDFDSSADRDAFLRHYCDADGVPFPAAGIAEILFFERDAVELYSSWEQTQEDAY